MASKRTDSLSVLGKELGQYLLLIALAYGLLRYTQAFWQDGLIMLAGSTAVMALMLLVKRDLATTVTGLAVGILGPLAEMRGVSAGAWSYSSPHIEGVPAWLFMIWGCIGVFVAGTYEFLRVLIAQAPHASNSSQSAQDES